MKAAPHMTPEPRLLQRRRTLHRQPLSENHDDFCIIDTETRSPYDVTVHGAYVHTRHCMVVIVTYQIGDGPVQSWVVEGFGKGDRLNWQNAPHDLHKFYTRAVKGEAWFVAWNAAFDRLALNHGVDLDPTVRAELHKHAPAGTPMQTDVIRIDMMIDAMAQGVASHLPPDLFGAAQFGGVATKKQANGKALIKLFSDAKQTATPKSHPVEWAEFLSYAIDDTAAAGELFWSTMPLTDTEWHEYWANEEINDRGMPVDVPFVERAAKLADLNAELADEAVARISRGALRTVNQHKAMLEWIDERLGHLAGVERILTRDTTTEADEDGNDVTIVEKSLERSRVEELLALLDRMNEEEGLTDEEYEAQQMLQVRLYGASATPKKFGKIVDSLDEGRLKGQYVFNGAPATGRFSSRGVQTHNLTRATVGTRDDELDVLEMIAGTPPGKEQETYDALLDKYGPVGRTLSRVIRPAFLAPEGYTLFNADWSAIEARALPWLAGSAGGNEVLRTFVRNDADPSLPDIYKVQAGLILNKPATEITKHERQSHGKVPVLSLGYLGGNGALHNMARAYGASFTDEEATGIVKAYRAANPWLLDFADDSWQAVLSALNDPGEGFSAGKITYYFDQNYKKGTLFSLLPCGRALMYPSMRFERRNVKNKFTGEIEEKTQLTYRRGRARAVVWKGLLCLENTTQAICGSLLRHVLSEFEFNNPGYLIGHTHDEIIGMSRVADAERMCDLLVAHMTVGPKWAAGLPLKAEPEINDWYTKCSD